MNRWGRLIVAMAPVRTNRTRPRFHGEPCGAEHDETVDMLKNLNRRAKSSLPTYFGYLCEFHDCNRSLFRRKSAALVRAHWKAAALMQNYQVSTITRIAHDMEMVGMNPRDHEGTMERIEAYLISNGIKRLMQGHLPGNVRRLYDLDTLYAPLLRSSCNNTHRQRQAHLDCRCSWYICVATGCRVSHTFDIREITLSTHGISILWGRRKASEAERAPIWYPFTWSKEPPANIRARLESVCEKTPLVAGLFADPSGAVLKWLRRHQVSTDQDLGTSDARTRMVHILRRRVEEGKMSEARYKKYLDHLLSTAEKSYRLATIFPGIDFEQAYESEVELRNRRLKLSS